VSICGSEDVDHLAGALAAGASVAGAAGEAGAVAGAGVAGKQCCPLFNTLIKFTKNLHKNGVVSQTAPKF